MKKIFSLLFSTFITTIAIGQTYQINNINNQTINTCGGTFYDSGGAGGFYNINETYTATFCPSTAGQSMRFDFVFSSWDVATGDQLCFFDGITTTAPGMGCFDAVTPGTAIQATATNSTGCLTVQWTSDNLGVGAGWVANLSCTSPCQTIEALVSGTIPTSVNDSIDICPGETVVFQAQGNYPQNGLFYTQSDALSNFSWVMEGTQYNSQTAQHTFNNPGGYTIYLEIEDTEGCTNTNAIPLRVRVSPDPTFEGTVATDNSMCTGDTSTLTGVITPTAQNFAVPISRGDSIFLPDGNGTCYTTSLSVGDFNIGQTITSVSDIVDICVNMEHSYMGDLDISIRCPNGQSVSLHQYAAGGGTYLGIPVDIDADLTPGQGFDYCWAENAPNSTWAIVAANGTGTLPAGTYTPDQSFTGLIGCPLNGDWQITVCDSLLIDNGYIFNWGINFNPNLYPSVADFVPTISTEQWENHPYIIGNQGDTIATITPAAAGTAAFTYSATNEFGCSYDTTINITVLPYTDPNCLECDSILVIPSLEDTSICAGESVAFDAAVTSSLDDIKFSFVSNTPIPTGTYLEAPITVSGILPNTISSSNIKSICVDISHPSDNDLDFELVAPSGQTLLLSSDNGGNGDNYTNTCFTPTATTPITAGSAPFTGDFLPEGNWSTFSNVTANGIWTLRVTDDQNGFNGTLNNWSITFGASHNIDYSWSPSMGLSCITCPNPTATPNDTTTYTVTLTDNYNCTTTQTVTVNVQQPLAAPVLSCGNSSSTSITANWTSVVGAIGYEINVNNTGWMPPNGGLLSHTLTGLTPNQSIFFEVRALNGICDALNATDTLTCFALPCTLISTLDSVSNVSCHGAADGVAYLSQMGGQLPISFTLGTTIQNNGIFTGLASGDYTIILQDGFGCLDSVSFTITQPDSLTVGITQNDVSCFGGNDGDATITVNGGTAPYNYAWNNSQSDPSISNLSAGTYTVTVTDANGCFEVRSITINEPPVLMLSTTHTDVTCFGGNDGTAAVLVSGGVGNYTYAWNPSANPNDSSQTNLSTGTYEVTITDSNGCVDDTSITVTEPTPLNLAMNVSDVSCFGLSDGTATVTATGGTMPYMYLWDAMPMQDSSTAVGLSGGNYGVTVTDSLGCVDSMMTTISEPTQISASFVTQPTTCLGLSNGVATVTATGGMGGYTYNWNTTPVQTTAMASNLVEGTYVVSITDVTNCTIIDTVNVAAAGIVITGSLSSTPPLCFDSNEGTTTAQGMGGTMPYTYVWNTMPMQTTATATGLGAGTYVVTISDAQGCMGIDSIAVVPPDSFSISFSTTDLLCFQDNSGTATAIPNGTRTPYVFLWENGQTDATATGLAAGFAVVTVTDAQGCFKVDSVLVTEPSLLGVTLSATSVSCHGVGDGTAAVTTTGGTLPYTYSWNNMQTTSTSTDFSGGFATVVVTDSNNCMITDSIFIQEQPALTTTNTSTRVSCHGAGDGTATISANGGAGNYIYAWDNGQTTATATNLAGSVYFYTITDSDNCSISDSVLVEEPTPITTTMTGVDALCAGTATGTATVSVSGGEFPYAYAWSTNGQTDSINNGLGVGMHEVTVTDSYGCVAVDSVFIDDPMAIQILTTSTPVSCSQGADGTAHVSAVGGVGNYTYLWNIDSTDALVSNLSAGFYYVTVSDNNDCSTTDSVEVIEPLSLNLSTTSIDVSCFGLMDGRATVAATGGNGDFQYQWSSMPTDTLNTVNNLIAGSYTVTVTDGQGCSDTAIVTLSQPTEISTTIGFTPVSCFGYDDGTVTVSATGGTIANDYQYTWNNTPQNASTNSNLVANWYYVTVTDDQNCFAVDSIEVEQPEPITLIMNQQPATCYNGTDGQANVLASGGNLDYQYLWTTFETTNAVTGLTGGNTYFVTVTDGKGCMASDGITIEQPAQFTATSTLTDATCHDADDGTGTALPTGGIPPFTYQWDGGANNQTTATAIDLSPNTYHVTVTDFNGCATTTSVAISEPPPLLVRFDLTDVTCFGAATGSAEAVAAGGTPFYTYQWQTNTGLQTGTNATNLTAGEHIVTLWDNNSCELKDTITINQPAEPLVGMLSVDSISCVGGFDGQIKVATTGGTAPYLYSLNDEDYTNSSTFIGLQAGTYEVIVQDDNGCTITTSAVITEPDAIEVDLGEDITIDFTDTTTLSADISNGIPPFTYAWTSVNNSLSCRNCPSPSVSALTADTEYALLVTDANGCTGSDQVYVRITKTRNVFVANAFTPNEDGVNDVLFVQGDAQVARVRYFRVFDRWGELVYRVHDVAINDDMGASWDGTFNGKPMNPNIFIWVAEVEFIDGVVKIYKGSALLIR